MRRLYSTTAHARAAIFKATGRQSFAPTLVNPYSWWRPVRLATGLVVNERLHGRPGFIATCRIQVVRALESAARFRRLGLPDAARAALADASAWRHRERLAVARGATSDRLWTGHRACLRSDPSTWLRPWTPCMVDLGHGMSVDAVMRRGD